MTNLTMEDQAFDLLRSTLKVIKDGGLDKAAHEYDPGIVLTLKHNIQNLLRERDAANGIGEPRVSER